jgi:hypothetical protein
MSDQSADSDGRLPFDSLSRWQLVGLVALVVLIAAFWYTRTWWHFLAYALYKTPGFVLYLVLGVGLFSIGLRRRTRSVDASRGSVIRTITNGRTFLSTSDGRWFMLVGALAIVLAFVAPVAGGAYANEKMADEMLGSFEATATLPESQVENARMLPESVARQYAQNSLDYPQHAVRGGDITVLNGTPHWSYGLQPSGGVNPLTKKQAGAAFVDMTTLEKDIDTREEEFRYGQGQLIRDDYQWQLYKDNYWRQYQDPFVVPHNGTAYLAVPYVTHEYKMRFTPLPTPYVVPRFGGVALLATDGSIEYLSPDEAETNAILDGQNYYPYSLARHRVSAMAYQNGTTNAWFVHDNQLQVAPVPGNGNDQPFTVFTDEGPQYIVAAEPYGESRGLYQIWLLDAQNGDARRLSVQDAFEGSSLLGPEAATRYVSNDPDIQRLTDVDAIEPIPVFRDDTLYWQVHIVPNGSAGVTYVGFVDAETREVYVLRGTSDVRAFLLGETEPPNDGSTPPVAGGEQNSSSSGLLILIERADGSEETVTVGPNETVVIRQQLGNTTSPVPNASG